MRAVPVAHAACCFANTPGLIIFLCGRNAKLFWVYCRYHYQIWQDAEAGKQRMERGTADQPALETVIEDQNDVSLCALCMAMWRHITVSIFTQWHKRPTPD